MNPLLVIAVAAAGVYALTRSSGSSSSGKPIPKGTIPDPNPPPGFPPFKLPPGVLPPGTFDGLPSIPLPDGVPGVLLPPTGTVPVLGRYQYPPNVVVRYVLNASDPVESVADTLLGLAANVLGAGQASVGAAELVLDNPCLGAGGPNPLVRGRTLRIPARWHAFIDQDKNATGGVALPPYPGNGAPFKAPGDATKNGQLDVCK